jgi:pimeloyl-ACP methyl ester carboxylesterase
MWGCGSSPGHVAPLEVTLDEYASAVVDELDALGVRSVDVVGSSIGGYSAYALWRVAPSRVRSLVLLSARAGADTNAVADERRSMAERALREGVEFVVEPMVQRLLSAPSRAEVHIADPVRGRIRRCTPEGVAACQSAMATRPDSTGLLHDISVPTLVVAGDHDGVVGLPEMEGVAAALPRGRFHVLPGVGHLANLEASAEVSALIAEFLASQAAA